LTKRAADGLAKRQSVLSIYSSCQSSAYIH
jgi:hypothetical protein